MLPSLVPPLSSVSSVGTGVGGKGEKEANEARREKGSGGEPKDGLSDTRTNRGIAHSLSLFPCGVFLVSSRTRPSSV